MTTMTLREILRHEESVLRPFLIGKRLGKLSRGVFPATLRDIRWYDDALLLRVDGDRNSLFKHEQRDSYPVEWEGERIEGENFDGWDAVMDEYGVDVDLMDILGNG